MAGAQRDVWQRGSRTSMALAVAIVVATLVAWAVWSRAQGEDAPRVARVTDADGQTYDLPLDEETTLEVATSLGTNVIEVADGRVRVREADCPHQDCVNQGWIESSGEQIVCLPHRLYVEVVGGDAADVDVTGR